MFYVNQLFDKLLEDFGVPSTSNFLTYNRFPTVCNNRPDSFKDFFPSYPKTDLYVNKNSDLVFDIAVTGFSEDQIEVTVENNTLRITAETKEKDDEDKKYIARNLARRAFDVSYKLDHKYDLKTAKVKLENGLLTITIPIQELLRLEKTKLQIEK
jgi:molecular chaperone IbpA